MEHWATERHREMRVREYTAAAELDAVEVHYVCHNHCESVCRYESRGHHYLELEHLDMAVDDHIGFVHRDMVMNWLGLYCYTLSVSKETVFAESHLVPQVLEFGADSDFAQRLEIAVEQIEVGIQDIGMCY